MSLKRSQTKRHVFAEFLAKFWKHTREENFVGFTPVFEGQITFALGAREFFIHCIEAADQILRSFQ